MKGKSLGNTSNNKAGKNIQRTDVPKEGDDVRARQGVWGRVAVASRTERPVE